MKGKGRFTHAPHRSMKLILVLQALWLGMVCLLGAWWGILLSRQATRIAELEVLAGITQQAAESQWLTTQRMLYWESLAFFLFILFFAGAIVWMYWRDVKRARSLQAFFASVTHELRTPLTSIRLQAESIADSTSSVEGKNLVHRLLEDTQRLESQVERTLELARVEGGGPVLSESLSLRSWLNRQIQSWKESYSDRVEVKIECPEEINVLADPSAIQVIFRNLLENSIRHSGKGRVQIKIQALPRSNHSNEIALLVTDNGKGFQEDVSTLGRLFRKGRNSQGAGVGLYLVKVLMERMGGRACFQLSENHGFQTLLSFKEGQ